MTNNPLTLLLMIGVSLYVIKLWFDDYKASKQGAPHARALPGAVPAPRGAYLIAALGAFVILGAETWGEITLGLSHQQSQMTALMAVYTLCAAFVEEIIFRGYLVVPSSQGPVARWTGILAASLVFAALHPFLWDWKEQHVIWKFDTKGWFSTGTVFLTSLWFYAVRFAPFNPRYSLGPCFAGHLAKNLGVIAVKAAQGYLLILT